MSDDSASAYDRILYPGHAFAQTHPDRLATLASLHGMQPAPLSRCRVLELGCGDGANLIPIACQWPDSEFIGVDLSERAIANGTDVIAELGLRNVTLHHRDIMTIGAEFGQFDYIASHGVYSWVPQAVREKMLSIFHANLAPQGVVYVSYNSYPGGYLHSIARAAMLYHVRGITDPRERIEQARGVLNFMAQASTADSVYGAVLRGQSARIADMPDQVLYHDDLDTVAAPFFLYQIADDAARHGLQYLSESSLPTMSLQRLPEEVRARLAGIPENQMVKRQQYLDFIEGRVFHESLFCRSDISLQRPIDPRRVRDYYLATSASAGAIDPGASDTVKFTTENGSTLTTDHRLSKAAIRLLGEAWPRALSFPDLLERSLAALGAQAPAVRAKLDEEEEALINLLFRAVSVGQVEVHLFPPRLAATITEHPEASLFARKQAESGKVVTNLRHRAVSVEDETVRRFLRFVDGTRTVDEIISDLNASLAAEAQVPPGDRRVGGAPPASAVSRDDVERNLKVLARLALLAA